MNRTLTFAFASAARTASGVTSASSTAARKARNAGLVVKCVMVSHPIGREVSVLTRDGNRRAAGCPGNSVRRLHRARRLTTMKGPRCRQRGKRMSSCRMRWALSGLFLGLASFLPLGTVAAADPKAPPKEVVLFDFEDQADLKAWANLELPEAKEKEPPARVELSPENATRGKQSLKITFAGGRWPTVTTTRVPEDWMPYWTFRADVTAGRDCVVGFTVLQEKSQRGGGWDATVSRWTKTEFLKRGKNTVTGTLHDPNHYSINDKLGKVVRFEIFMYSPHEGESIYVDNIRLSTEKEDRPKVITKFPV